MRHEGQIRTGKGDQARAHVISGTGDILYSHMNILRSCAGPRPREPIANIYKNPDVSGSGGPGGSESGRAGAYMYICALLNFKTW